MQQLDLPGTLALFSSRLDTLAQLLTKAETHFAGRAAFLELRLAPDMFPLRTQVVFACNQPRHLARWCKGQPLTDPGPELTGVAHALQHVGETKALLDSLASAGQCTPARASVPLGPGLTADLSAHEYVNDFLVPNFYFHLVTAYAILRMTGLPIGKADYMSHMRKFVR